MKAAVHAIVLLGVSAAIGARLIGSAPHKTHEPTDEELQEAAAIIATGRSRISLDFPGIGESS